MDGTKHNTAMLNIATSDLDFHLVSMYRHSKHLTAAPES